jgi:hypothetical protein
MRYRAVVASGLVLAVAVGGAAGASTKPKPKPKPVCDLVNDPAQDARFDPTAGFTNGALGSHAMADPNADIVSADLASNAKYVTGVIRVRSLAVPDAAWPEAHFYMLSWGVPGHTSSVYLGATIDPNPASAAYGPQFVFGDSGTAEAVQYFNIDQAAKVKGSVNTAKGTITMSVPIADLAGYGVFKPGTDFSAITASSQQLVNGPVLPANAPGVGGSIAWGWPSDSDSATRDYIAGTPSCVTPGS